jgi:hypothetical protein
MTLTLWRGKQLVGELLPRSPAYQPHQRAGKPPSLAAFLIRAADVPVRSPNYVALFL